MTGATYPNYNATCVAIGGQAILVTGASGIGKSELALMLIDRGAKLVSDDYVTLQPVNKQLIASPPSSIAGKLEVRNLGILNMPHLSDVPVAMHFALDTNAPRFVESAATIDIFGIALPSLTLFPISPALPIKVELALQTYGNVNGKRASR